MFIRKKRNEHQCSYIRTIVSESDSNDLLMSKVSVVLFDGFDISHHIRVIIIHCQRQAQKCFFKMANTMFVLQACLLCFALRILHMFSLFMLNGDFFRSSMVISLGVFLYLPNSYSSTKCRNQS